MAIALVTGTSSGLGLATAVSLARAGHTVTATMRNLDGGADLRQIIAKEKLPITLTALDVDDDDFVNDAFAKVVAEHGSIDILVNNAGIPGAAGGVEEIPFNVFQQVMQRIFSAPFAASRPSSPACANGAAEPSSTSLRSRVGSRGLRLHPMPRRNGP